MSQYRIIFWTAPTSRSTSHEASFMIKAKDSDDARKKILDKIVQNGVLCLNGFDTDDPFGGMDKDYYEIGTKTKRQFRAQIEKMISRVERV